MNKLMTTNTMTSMQIAEVTGKRHADIMRDIRDEIEKLAAGGISNERKFALVGYTDTKGEKRPCYQRTKEGVLQLAARYDAVVRAKLIELAMRQDKPQSIEDLIIMQAQSMKQLKAEVAAQGEQIQTIKETLIEVDEDWRRDINTKLNKIAYKRGGGHEYSNIRTLSYDILDERAHSDLDRRLNNLKARLKARGETQTRINNINYVDVIEADPRIKEIYTAIVKDLAIKYLA